MRVILISAAFPPAGATTAGDRALAEHLVAAGHGVHVIAPGRFGAPAREERGLLCVDRLPMPAPVVDPTRIALGFAVESARRVIEIHARRPVDVVDAAGAPLADLVLATIGVAGAAPAPVVMVEGDDGREPAARLARYEEMIDAKGAGAARAAATAGAQRVRLRTWRHGRMTAGGTTCPA
jgi:hypothetical protein